MPLIEVNDISKSYIIAHEERERYTALRDVVAKKAKKIFSFPKSLRFTEHVSKEEFWALKDINFEVKQGDRVGIIGRNGAGKSTLLKILSRITEPTSGKIKLSGRVASLLEVGTGFHPELTGRENIFLNGAILGMSRAEIKKHFDAIVDFAEVEKFLDTPVKRYSSGMYVRLAFAVAAHLEPEILIVDEVLAVGDAQFQKKCLGKMEEVSRNDGRTILFVSHDLSAVNRLCEKGILLSKGMIQKSGLIADVINSYTATNTTENEIHLDDIIKYVSINQIDDELVINCKYEFDKIAGIPCFGFVVSDQLNKPIFGTNPLYQPPHNKLLPSKKGELITTIKYPKLLNGSYNLSVWFGDGITDYFHKESLLTFEVVNMVKYEKEAYVNQSGPVSPVVNFEQLNFQ